jgi:ribose 5-phosphate isomerase B
MKIIIGSDHAGFILKSKCVNYIANILNFKVKDIGAHEEKSVDYPFFAHEVAGAVANGEFDRGILVCGSGIGMSIVANRHKGVRAALCHNIYSARMSRMHNDANVLTMGERVIGEGLAMEIVEAFLNTSFEGGRHKNRVDQIEL